MTRGRAWLQCTLAVGIAGLCLRSAAVRDVTAPAPVTGEAETSPAVLAAAEHSPSAKRRAAARNAIEGKPASPIGVSSRFLGEPAVGQPLVVELTIRSPVPLTGGRLELGSGEGLIIGAPGPTIAIPDLAADEAFAVAITVTPLVADVHHLTVFVAGQAGGRPGARSLVVPIRLLPEKAAPGPALKQEQGGRSIRPLPVDETVR